MEATNTTQQTCSASSGSSTQDKAFNLKVKYPTEVEFERDYSAQRQLAAMSNPLTYVIDQSAPQLRTMEKAYGSTATKSWMIMQMMTMLGGGNMIKGDEGVIMMQLSEMAEVLFERFKNEKATVFILFCAKCRAHDYKISYGSIKVDAILDAAGEFFRDCLYKLKTQAGYELQKADRETNLVEDTSWKHVTNKNLFWAWRDGTLRLWDNEGEKALSKCLETYCLGKEAKWPEHHTGICAMLAIGALWADQYGHAHFNNEAFEAHIENLRDLNTYLPAHNAEYYNEHR